MDQERCFFAILGAYRNSNTICKCKLLDFVELQKWCT